MIHRLPTNCRRKLFHLLARLDTDATKNEVTPLNSAELCESVVFLHSQIILTMLMNDSKTADELPTKLYHLLARLDTDATINEGTLLNPAELCESVVFLHSPSILTMLIKDSQTADELPTKIISFVGEAEHRRNHEWSNSSESRRIVRKCSFVHSHSSLTVLMNDPQSADEMPKKKYFIYGRGCTQMQPWIK